MKKILAGVVLVFCVILMGCDSLRFAPSEQQKQNAWLHNRTAFAAVQQADSQDCSTELKQLAKLSELQSRAFVSYYGLPEELPQADNSQQILTESNFQLADTALTESAERPDGWQVADNVLELGIGICALLGGVYGTKAVDFLKDAKTKSQALREIIAGNELFKRQNAQSVQAFKDAQQGQSATTRQLVAEMKS
jgi:hypothetical protein